MFRLSSALLLPIHLLALRVSVLVAMRANDAPQDAPPLPDIYIKGVGGTPPHHL